MHIAIFAGEASGDQLGADLIESFLRLNPCIRFDGVGGPKMINRGFTSLISMDEFAVMGIAEVVKSLPKLIQHRNYLVDTYRSSMPDVFIGIDYPDFNLSLEARLKELGIFTVHYVSPSVWAWREKRINKIKASCDLMLTLFDFEKKFYDQHQMPAVYCGHPLINKVKPAKADDIATSKQALKLSPVSKYITIMPGSRLSEVKQMLPIFIETAAKLKQKQNALEIIIPLISNKTYEYTKTYLNNNKPPFIYHLLFDKAMDAMTASDVILLASGTVALEAMLLEKPMVVAYKVNPITAMIAKRLLTINKFSLPNLLADQHIVSEYIQDEINTDEMADELNELINSPLKRKRMIESFSSARTLIQKDGANIAAQAIYDSIISQGVL